VLLCELGDHTWTRAFRLDREDTIMWRCDHCERWISFARTSFTARLNFLRSLNRLPKRRFVRFTYRQCNYGGPHIQVYWTGVHH
jgi:hypothetical protein